VKITNATLITAAAAITLTACGPSKVEEDTAAMRQIMEKQENEKYANLKKQSEAADASLKARQAERKKEGF
jgi:hypothetical protein